MITTASSFPTIKPNSHWAKLPLFNRKNWFRFRFGDVVENVNERVEPSTAGEEIYVGLEDLDSGSLHIRRWGKGSDVIGTKLRFRKGDVIFGRRRAYQRKLAVAEMDGICSAHAMVARANPKVVLPEFLPFLMMSNRFMNRAVEISVGSLSPTINWTALKLEEFDLPPIDQQRRMAEILWAVDQHLLSAMELQSAASAAKDAFFDDELQKSTKGSSAALGRLGNALSGIVAGKSPKSSSSPASDDEFGVLKVSAAGDGVFRDEENKALLDASDFVPALEVRPGMILVTRCNALLAGIGRACLVEKTRPGLMLCDKTLQLVPNETLLDRDFLLQGLRQDPYRGFVERSANGTEAKNITQETLRAAPFWIPTLSKQRAIVERLRQFAVVVLAAQEQRASLEKLRSAFTNALVQ